MLKSDFVKIKVSSGFKQNYGSSHLIDTSNDYHTTMNGVDKVKIPGRNEIPATTLIQLSGGVDSTYILWKKYNFCGEWCRHDLEDHIRKCYRDYQKSKTLRRKK